ncbi:hypothetical protein C8J57DRAFT_1255359 [Mycena rebaudengoi]|nr:hypothetical protein C8J57DRAFT_1255359 [Mycena rebaudengoi]
MTAKRRQGCIWNARQQCRELGHPVKPMAARSFHATRWGGEKKKRITAEGIHSGRVKCRCAYLCNEAAAQSTNFVHCSVCLEGVPACVDNFTLRRRTSEFNASPDPIKVPINQEQTTCSSYSR